ncbi:Gfo/Idh/MocA family protein [Jiangella ureilytica]|uniref:Gfo/Idh/MocA family protein n=1 Tax=Jiangella ureilytica TaxID=2530374 RepID=UPI0013A5DF25|nr:Gfo/Idh/MocA family oxidoreductase [Jiangella ureilytica]
MTRIGVVGTDSSHVDQFVRLLNVEHRFGAARVVALTGGDTERNRELAAAAGAEAPRLLGDPAELVGAVDAVLVSTRDGRGHRAEAVPFIEAGLPVFVDKPLAGSAEDAAAIVRAAQQHGVPLYSGSALRFVPAIEELTAPGGPLPQLITVSGPANAAGQYGGLYFYGIHLVEAARRLSGDPGGHGEVAVSVDDQPSVVTATTTLGATEVRIDFVADATPFRAILARPGGPAEERELALPPDYIAPVLARFLAAVATGRAPTDAEAAALLAPIALLDAIVARLP